MEVMGKEVMKNMVDEVAVLTFPAFTDTGMVEHGFSTRIGGVSTGAYASMNLSFSRGDDQELVRENFRRFGAAIDTDIADMVFSAQTHATNIRRVTALDKGKGILAPQDYNDVDGLITDEPGISLVTFYADCLPLFFVDPVNRAIGVGHSGWRGTVRRMGEHMIQAMTQAFGSRPENLIAVIGPSICQKCYEVCRDVANAFALAFDRLEYMDFLIDNGNDHYQLDLWKANWYMLRAAGLTKAHIHTAELCTCCNSDWLWSHRVAGDQRGSLAGFLMLKKQES